MAFAAPALAAVGGGSALVGGATVLSAIGSGIGILGRLQQGKYQEEVAQNQARMAELQANQTRQRGQIEQQETDFAALREMGANEVRRAGSGFGVGSTSFNRQRRLEGMLARRDALRIRDNAEREALTLQNQAASSRAEGAMAKRGSQLDALGGAFTLGSDLISGAALANKRKSAQLGLES